MLLEVCFSFFLEITHHNNLLINYMVDVLQMLMSVSNMVCAMQMQCVLTFWHHMSVGAMLDMHLLEKCALVTYRKY